MPSPEVKILPKVHVGRSKYCGVSEDTRILLRLDDDVTRLQRPVSVEVVQQVFRVHVVLYLRYTRRAAVI